MTTHSPIKATPEAPCHWVRLGEPHDAHRRTVREDHGSLHTVRRVLCPGVSDQAPATTDKLPTRYYVQQTGSEYRVVDGDHDNRPYSHWTSDFDEVQAMRESAQRAWERRARATAPNQSQPESREQGVRCGHCSGRHATVADVKACATATPEDPFRRATNANERAQEEADAARVPTRRAPAEEGMYRKDGVIYKVQVAHHGSGRPYAKELVFREGRDMGDSGLKGTWHFEYAPGAVRELGPEHQLTLEQAKEFGQLYGTCCVCGRVLTDEKSIAAGIGPVCAGRL
jgi:hypothetical protein